MVYVLYDEHKIYGVYETIELLRANCFIINFKKMKKNQIKETIYVTVNNILTENPNLELNDLQKIMYRISVFIERKNFQENGLYALENILKHIDKRFDILAEKLTNDSRVVVKFPGKNSVNNKMITHNIEENWRSLDPDNYNIIINELRKFLITRIQKLELEFTTRIKFGTVSGTYASEVYYQVWPADKENWDLPNNSPITGTDFAVCFEYQTEGVFGIVVDPLYGYTGL